MKVIIDGHLYLLEQLDTNKNTLDQNIQFVDRGHDRNTAGTTNQEVIRVLIDRVKFLEKELHSDFNDKILYHLRMALMLHEARALLRKTEKGKIEPELLKLNQNDLHINISTE